MAKNIEPKLRKIGDYLKLEYNTIFTIPEYQLGEQIIAINFGRIFKILSRATIKIRTSLELSLLIAKKMIQDLD